MAAVIIGLSVGGAESVLAQADDYPPVFVSMMLSTTPCGVPTPWLQWVDPCLKEGDTLYICLEVQDLDFNSAETDTQEDQQVILVTMESMWVPYFDGTIIYGPEPPTVSTDRTGAFNDDENSGFYTGFAPPAGTISNIELEFLVPQFNGENQAKLRGLIDYDVAWFVSLTVRNEAGGNEDFAPDRRWFRVCAVENPALAPGNPPPFADAGPDQTVAAGATVTLDGSRTFDGSNIGFSPFDPEVFAKDDLQYTWEWISGPARIDPEPKDDGNAATAQVKLDAASTSDNPYVYRLLVEDLSNAVPSTDEVQIHVRFSLPVNRGPVAVASGPAGPVPEGAVITLDGTGSSDPDGEPVTYRWRQTNEVGGDLTADQILSGFQPVSGLESASSSWRAVSEGTYYFRLLVTDPSGESAAASVTVRVVGEAALSATMAAVREPAPAEEDTVGAELNSETTAPANGCGGGLLPLAMLPMALWFMRGRYR